MIRDWLVNILAEAMLKAAAKGSGFQYKEGMTHVDAYIGNMHITIDRIEDAKS